VLNLGGKDIQGKGWKVAPHSAVSSAVSSPSKAPKKAAAVQFISPDGKRFDSPQAVFKHLGPAGISRAEAVAKSQATISQHSTMLRLIYYNIYIYIYNI
jgi:hypothetical protein